MKIAVYGATGMIGSCITQEAASRGHQVTALSRHGGASGTSGVADAIGDASDHEAVAALAAEHDVVVSALGPSRGRAADAVAFPDMIAGLAKAVGATRVVVVGGAGSLLAAPGVRLADTPGFPDEYKSEALAQAEALEVLRSCGPEVDWTYLSPAPVIAPGDRTGRYVTGLDSPAGDAVSVEDYAVALIDEIETPTHRRQRFTVAN